MILNTGSVTAPTPPTTTVHFDALCPCGRIASWQVTGSDRVGSVPTYRIECDCTGEAERAA